MHLEHFEDGSSAAWIYVSSYHSNSLAMLSPDGRVGVLAGCGAARHTDGVGFEAAFHAPNGLAIDAEGKLYVADSGNHCVRKVRAARRLSMGCTSSDGACTRAREDWRRP